MPDPDPRVNPPSRQRYSSLEPAPLLRFAMHRRCLLVGGPGRGRAATAIKTAPPQIAFTEAEADHPLCAARLAPAQSRCSTFAGVWQGCLRLRPYRLDPALVCLACAEYHRLNLSQRGHVADLATGFSRGLDDNRAAQVRARRVQVERVPVEP